MNTYKQVQDLLDRLVAGRAIGAHGAFWRNLSRDQLVVAKVFGFPLLVVGDSANSNLIKALSGSAPFGSDQGTAAAMFRRMPAGLAPASAADLAFLANWIDAGCPEDLVGPLEHNSYWRDFDNWAMFEASEEVGAAIGEFFPKAQIWFQLSKNQVQEAQWIASLASPAAIAALQLLSSKQIETVTAHYGNPPDYDDVFEGYELFGRGELPDDPLRPQDPKHQMNGREMWFFWSAFSDICIRKNIDKPFWLKQAKAILIGLLNDGLFRGRFTVQGFTRDAAGKAAIKAYAAAIQDQNILRELATRFVQSGVA